MAIRRAVAGSRRVTHPREDTGECGVGYVTSGEAVLITLE